MLTGLNSLKKPPPAVWRLGPSGHQIVVTNPLTGLPADWTHALAGYPLWIEIAVGIVAAVVFLWILGKVLKLALYLVLIVAVAYGLWMAFWTLWDLWHPLAKP